MAAAAVLPWHMAKAPLEYDLVHPDGREERVVVEGKTLSVVVLLGGEILSETQQVHRFGPQAAEAAKAHVWAARERGFDERIGVSGSDAESEGSAPEMLTLYHVAVLPGRGTWQRGALTTYLLDGKRLRTNDAIQEFASEDDARSALERMVRPSEDYSVTKELVRRSDEGLQDQALTDMLTHNVTHFERNEADGRLKIRFREPPNDSSRYSELLKTMVLSEAATLHLYCNAGCSPGDAWTSALTDTELPFRHLIFDTYWETLTRQQDHSLGDLALTLERMPNIERMFISGNIRASPLEHSTLRELYLLGDPLDDAVLQALAESSLPSLQKLVLCVRQESAAANDALLLESLLRLKAPALSVLCVYGLSEPLKVAAELARTMPSLRALAAEGSVLEEELEALTEAELAPLATLAYLELELDGCEPPDSVSARLPHLHELNSNRILPTEYESW